MLTQWYYCNRWVLFGHFSKLVDQVRSTTHRGLLIIISNDNIDDDGDRVTVGNSGNDSNNDAKEETIQQINKK